jgi:hypothetical protein
MAKMQAASEKIGSRNKALVLEAVDTLFKGTTPVTMWFFLNGAKE